MADADGNFHIEAPKIRQHVSTVRQKAAALKTAAEPVAGLVPGSGSSWIGSVGGQATLRACVDEIVKVLRDTSDQVASLSGDAMTTLAGYQKLDATLKQNVNGVRGTSPAGTGR